MSTKVALFAFSQTTPDETILRELRIGVRTVAEDVSMGPAFIRLMEIQSVKFALISAQGRSAGSGVARGTITDGFWRADYPVAFLGYDDQNGISLIDCTGSAQLFLLSDADNLGGDVGKLTIDYAQKGYTQEQLAALRERPASELTERELAAISDYNTAVSIGLRQVFDWRGGTSFVKICFEKQGYRVDDSTLERVDVPLDALPLVAFWPMDDDFYRAKIPSRDY